MNTLTISTPAKPLPRVTPDNQPFWEACRKHKLELPFCDDCGKAHLPPGPVCPFCFSSAISWRTSSGRGHISTWVVVRKRWLSSFANEVPYNVVQVELDEGPRLTTSIVDIKPEELAIGLKVEVVFDDRTDKITLPRFRRLTL
jgi:uncharacterized protein